jgi:hypothetical protein
MAPVAGGDGLVGCHGGEGNGVGRRRRRGLVGFHGGDGNWRRSLAAVRYK